VEVSLNTVQILSLLLAMSLAINIGFIAGFTALRSGLKLAQAVLLAGGATGGAIALFLTGVSAYR
jgi:hypothetical protein